jgi:hypothetical protein
MRQIGSPLAYLHWSLEWRFFTDISLLLFLPLYTLSDTTGKNLQVDQSLGKFRRKVFDKLTRKKYHVNGSDAKKCLFLVLTDGL